jgi:thioredoxin reductase (NADPH)
VTTISGVLRSAPETPVAPPVEANPADGPYPVLTPSQLARLAALGRQRQVDGGEVLIEVGVPLTACFVVLAGRLSVVHPSITGDVVVVEHGPGTFTGEETMLSGRPAITRVRAAEASTVIEIDRARLLTLVQSDAEFGQLFLRAYVLRRVVLVAGGFGDVVLLGSRYCADTLRLREFLTRNGHPYTWVDLDRDAGVQELLERFSISTDDVPVLLTRDGTMLRRPRNEAIARALGLNTAVETGHLRDLVVVGAGPAGLAAAVYGASEGLDVLVIEASAPGGQAGTSSRIENYLGFPYGIAGGDLASLAYGQASKFGAQFLVAHGGSRLRCDQRPLAVQVGEGSPVSTRAVIIATGAAYRRLPLTDAQRFEGVGVYYAATFMEAQLSRDEEVVVVGGGNSAGQAALFLAQTASHVHMLVRSSELTTSMSRYLIRRIEANPAITLRTRTEVIVLGGGAHLERVRWIDRGTGAVETRRIRHVFTMTGADPCTEWLEGCVALDKRKFIRTGPDLTAEDLAAARWPLQRTPFLLETCLPGVFAVGDVRSGNVKRVASAVGEGSIAVSFVHRLLNE